MDDSQILIVGALWVIIGMLIGYMAGKARGHEGLGALLGMIFGPLIALLVAFLPDARSTCPHCRAPVDPSATKCRHCASDLVPRYQQGGRTSEIVRRPQDYHPIKSEPPPWEKESSE